MLAKYLSFVFLATLAVAKVPSYFMICGRRNPNFDQCLLEATNAARDKLKAGIPELDLPPLEPLQLEGLALSETEALTAYARDIKISGLTSFITESNHIDFEKQTFDAVRLFKKLTLDADYDVKSKIIVPIAGRGRIRVVTDDVRTEFTSKFKLIKKNGKKYLFASSVTTKLIIKDYTADFKPAEGSDDTLTSAINVALQEGRREILETIKPYLEKVTSELIINLFNKIFSHMDFDEIFPDRE